MMLEIEPITNISRASLHARHKEIRARIWKPLLRPPAITRFTPEPITRIPYTSLPLLNQPTNQHIPNDSGTRASLPPQAPPRPPTIRNIVAEVAAFHNITTGQILSPSRERRFVRPRQIACYLAKSLTNNSLPQIGRRIGGRDHTTVLHSTRTIERLMTADELLASTIDTLRQRFIPSPPEPTPGGTVGAAIEKQPNEEIAIHA